MTLPRLLTLGLLLALLVLPLRAQEAIETDTLAALAQHMPRVDVFFATSANATFEGQLNMLVERVLAELPPDLVGEVRDFRDLLAALATLNTPEQTSDVRGLVEFLLLQPGTLDALALGVENSVADDTSQIYVLLHGNLQALRSILSLALDTTLPSMDLTDTLQFAASTEVASVWIARDHLLLALPVAGVVPQDLTDTRLADLNTFENAVDALPLAAYPVLIYADTPRLLRGAVAGDGFFQNALASIGIDLNTADAAAFGLILDDNTLLLDIAQTRDNADPRGFTAIDPAFARAYTDDETAFYFQATEVDALFDIASGLFAAVQARSTPDDTRQRFANAVNAVLRLDFEEDIVANIGDNLLIFANSSAGLGESAELQVGLEIGILVEMRDTAAAAQLSDAFVETALGLDTVTATRYRDQGNLQTYRSSDDAQRAEVVIGNLADRFLIASPRNAERALMERDNAEVERTLAQLRLGDFAQPLFLAWLSGAELETYSSLVVDLLRDPINLALTSLNVSPSDAQTNQALDDFLNTIEAIAATGSIDANNALILRTMIDFAR